MAVHLRNTLNVFVNRPGVRWVASLKDRQKAAQAKPIRRIEHDAAAIAAKGYLRPLKPYTPPSDVTSKLNALFNEVLGAEANSGKAIDSGRTKYKLLAACHREFQHSVPNSQLHLINNTDDIVAFYSTPVDTRVPLDKFKSVDLPANLHIQYDYHRFHPETDTMFGGMSAFPKSSTIVTGLKYKKKYAGYKAKTSWP